MLMLRFLYRKMWNTRWLTLSALAGLILAVAFSTGIAMYADGSLKQAVAKSLQEKSGGLPAGSLLIRYQAIGGAKTDLAALHDVDTYIGNEIPKLIGFPAQTYAKALSLRSLQIRPVDPAKVDASKRRQMTVTALAGIEQHADIAGGRWFSNQPQGDAIEAVVLEETLYRNDFRVGDEFYVPNVGGAANAPLKVKVVGTYMPKAGEGSYWFQGLESLVNSFVVSDELFQTVLLKEKSIPLSQANWYYAFDLNDIQISQLSPLSRALERLDINLYQKLKETRVDISFLPLLAEFKKQSLQLQVLLFTLAAPMLAMVFYYIAVNARQALERQRSDIAVMRGRGASNRQLVLIFSLEGFILGGAALLLGPMLGWFIAKSIGSTSGFLSFVDRKSIPLGFSWQTVLTGFSTVLIALAASVIPAFVFARETIVGYKRKQARADRKPFWQRWFLDIVLIALSAYGWYLFDQRRLLSVQTGLGTDQLQVHPLLFFMPALTIFALGLFGLRLFPLLLKVLTRLGNRLLSPPVYLTLVQLSRSAKGYYAMMLLLILTLGLGIYNASAARTIDLNSTERLLYQYGADVVLQTEWEGVAEEFTFPQDGSGGANGAGAGTVGGIGGMGGIGSGGQGSGSGGQGSGGSAGGAGPNANGGYGGSGGTGGTPGEGNGGPEPPKIRYVEPPFEIFRQLDGVEQAARVLRTKGNVVISGKSAGQGIVLGVDNVDFAEVAWFRSDLFPAHPNQYLNLLGAYEQAVIVPGGFAAKYQLKTGDLLSIAIQQQMTEFVVVGIVPYWPSQYPDETPFFVANLDYIYDQAPLIPYEVWLKMKPGAKLAPAIAALQQKKIGIASVKDVRNELIAQKKHPARGGVFGILSLGFLVSAFVSLIGYVLYWFYHLSVRVVQFGVLRAMGLTRRQLTRMLFLEQLCTTGLSVALGIALGKLAGYLYLPFLQISENVRTQVPPFRIVFDSKDTMQLYVIVIVMMLIGAALLTAHIRKLKVHDAVKLGEER